MVGLNDILWSFFGEMINTSTLNSDVLLSLQVLIDIFSVLFAFLILWWFLTIPYKIFKISRGRL